MTAIRKSSSPPHDVPVDSAIARAHVALGKELAPGSVEARDFCAKLSASLLNDPRLRPFPELQALGFWLRSASVANMLEKYLDKERRAAGIVFQIPPSNVDALFGYTLAIALLCGNADILRLPNSPHQAHDVLIDIIEENLAQAPEILHDRVVFIRYGHDDTITGKLSSVCDVRLVWGSDATIEHMQSLPLRPSARAINFGDRFSAAAINAARYVDVSETERDTLVKNLFNDIYWFDQLACSSPRLLAWVGQGVAAAAADFYPRFAAYAASRGYDPGAGGNLAKLNVAYLAMHDLAPQSYTVYGPQLSVITLDNLAVLGPFKVVNYGYGLLVEAHLDRLEHLIRYTEKRDQTLSVWGFEDSETQAFAAQCRGKGYSRVVPAGQALNFDAEWEGVNLFKALTNPKGKTHD